MNNRILAMLLAIIMIVSIVPVNADATENAVCTHAATDRVKVDAKAATCEETGNKEYYRCKCTTWFADMTSTIPLKEEDVIIPVLNHVDTDESHLCDYGCGTIIHNVQPVAKVDPDCTTSGNLAYFKCAYQACGKVFKDSEGKVEGRESDYILNPVHTITFVEAKAAKCGEKGNNAYYYCEKCDKAFAEESAQTILPWTDVTLEALSHEYDYTAHEYGDNSHDAKCKHCGLETGGTCVDTEDHNHICDKCGAMLLHTDYDVTTAPKAPATCTEPGVADHYVCATENCGSLFLKENGVYVPVTKDQIAEVPATGHAPSNHIYRDKEYHWQLCNNGCEEILNKTAHTGGEWSVYPSNTKQHRQICTVCGESFNATDHTYEHEAKEYGTDSHVSTCTACKSYITPGCVDKDGDHKCDDCLAVMAKIHESGLTYVAEVPAKCGVEGVKAHYKCDDCGTLFSGSQGSRIVSTAELKIDALEHQLSGWKSDGTAHWKECIRAGCPAELQYAEHTPGVCHEYPSDKSKHFEQCTVCVRSLNIREHEYTYTSNENGISHKAECKDCGKVRETAGCYDKDKNCYCDACGGLVMHTLAPLTTVKQDPKCGIVGYKEHYKCNTCQNLFDINCNVITLESVTIPALQHKWWPKGLDLSGTLHTEMCEYCKVISFKNHFDNTGDCMCDYAGCTEAAHEHTVVHVAAKAATCTEQGNQEYWYFAECNQKFADEACTQPLSEIVIYGKVPHTESDWKACEDGKNHALYCLTCEELLKTKKHDFTGEAPYCVDCGAAEGLEPVDEVSATCTSTGMKAHWISSITQRRYSDAAGTKYISDVSSLVEPKLPHEMAVESSNGTTHVIGCENCAEEYTEACSSEDGNCVCDICETVFAGHTLTAVAGKAPTCTKNGQAEALYCAKCDKYYAAEDGAVLATIEIKPLGHQWQTKWYNDVREGTHSKNCLRSGCGEKISEAHDLAAYDLYSGNLHEWRCSICEYKESELHADSNGDSICDECEHGSNKAVDAGDLSNHRETITIKTDKNASTQEKKNTWWKSFVGKLNPSYVGESQSSSAPSANVENPVPNGSGVSSGTTSGASQNAPAGSTTPSSGTIGAVVNFLMNLLNTLFGI